MEVDWAGFTQLQQQNNQLNNPMQRFAQGFQIGALMRQQNAINQAKEQETLAKQQLVDRQNALQAELESISTVTDPMQRVQRINNAILKFPEVADKLKTQATFYSDEVKSSTSNMLLPALNALNLGNKDVAIERLTVARDAFKNGGNKRGAEALDSYISDIQSTDNVAPLVQTGYLTLASIIGPDKIMEALSKSQDYAKTQAVMPSEIGKAESEAAIKAEQAKQEVSQTAIKAEQAKQAPLETQIKATQAKYAESQALLDLEKKGWDVQKIQLDTEIAKQNKKIATINAEYARALNETKKSALEAKRDEAIAKRDDSIRAKAAEIESSRAVFDNTLNTIQRILNTPFDVVASAAGPIDSKSPTLLPSTANFEALLDNLKSQAFMSQVQNMKGMGALSNAEGDKLQSSVQNLSLSQSANQLLSNVREVKRLTEKARKNLALKFGVPDTEPDVPAAKPVVKVKRTN